MKESLKQYLDENKDNGDALPYLNAIDEYEPDPGKERKEEDDKPFIFDANVQPLDFDVNNRIRMPKKLFDRAFVETMTFFRETEHLQYEAVQRGELSIEKLDEFIITYLNRDHPEVKHEVDRRKLIERLNTAIYGYYVLQPLIDNSQTSDIKVCGPDDIRVRIKGKAYSSNAFFINEEDLTQFVAGICMRNNVGFGSSPVITFADQHEKNYILRFVISHPRINMVNYPYLHIRKVPRTKPDFDKLIEDKMLTKPIKDYLINKAKYSRAIVFAGPPGCVDRETEFFNGKEWKSLADYKEGDKVLQYDTETDTASLTDPIRYIKAPCDKMYHFETCRGLDMTLSPEHNVLYYNRHNGKYSSAKVISAEEMVKIQRKGNFQGFFKTAFDYSGPGIDLSDTDIKIMLAVICDGTFNKHRNDGWCVINIKKERKKEELRKLLAEGHYDFTEHDHENGYTRFGFHAKRIEKEFSSYWYNCSHHQFEVICENILKWDGTTNKNSGTKSFSTTSKKTADFVQFAYSACGYRCSISLDHRKGKPYKTGGKIYTRKSDCYNLIISKQVMLSIQRYQRRDGHVDIVDVKPSDGYKYCFEVPTHTLILRRRDRIFLTKNSGKTTALNAFIEHIPKTRETLVIQENDELFTKQPGFMFKHVTHGYDGFPAYSLEDLGRMALVEGCNEFIVGEVKGGEMRNVMTLVNAGGYAALTVHSTNAYETLDKLADLVKYGSSYSFDEARRMLKTFDTVVYMEGYKIREILEVNGYNDKTKQYNYTCVYRYDPDRALILPESVKDNKDEVKEESSSDDKKDEAGETTDTPDMETKEDTLTEEEKSVDDRPPLPSTGIKRVKIKR